MRRSALHIAGLLAMGLALALGSQAEARPAAQSQTIRIRAWVDGRSNLILVDDTAQWQHFEWAAPGRLDCNIGMPMQATFVDQVEWWPIWPDVPDCENRDCGGCTTDVAVGFSPGIPEIEQLALVFPIAVRGTCTVLESPSAANGYRVVIEFDDSWPSAADWYEIDLVLGDGVGEPYCQSTPNSSGAAATISCSGSLSISANDTFLHAQGCPPDRIGIFFYGAEPMQVPLANGYLCVNPFYPSGLYRISPAAVVGASGSAQAHLDFASLPSAGAIAGGTTWCFQYWFRDPAAGGAGSNLSNGVQIQFAN